MTDDFTRCNHLPSAESVVNRFYLLRHGRSEANARSVIASRLPDGASHWGLTPDGRRQVEDTVSQSVAGPLRGITPIIVTSPFLRTVQTASIAAVVFQTTVREDDRLRERDFGEFEGLDDSKYEQIWAIDPSDPSHTGWNSESVVQVVERSTRLVAELNESAQGQTFLLVTHCDVAMILTSAAGRINPGDHRRLDPITTGELRELTIKSCEPDQSV